MKSSICYLVSAVNMIAASATWAGLVTLDNVTAAQLPGEPVVEIAYDLGNPSGGAHVVTLEVSTNGGVDFNVPCTHFSGDIGSGIIPGTQKKITWDAGADLPAVTVSAARVRVSATDGCRSPDMAYVPAGSFRMGDSTGDGGDYEVPRHDVYVSGFQIGRYEVSNEELREVYQWAYERGKFGFIGDYVSVGFQTNFIYFGAPKCQITWDGTNFLVETGKESYPCIYVSWYGAMAYCSYKNEMDGMPQAVNLSDWTINWESNGYRLPTEAEWERAARGGKEDTRFPWHDSMFISHSRANYRSDWFGGKPRLDYDKAGTEGYHPTWNTGTKPYTSPVGWFEPTGYGMYDMAGNVEEWCWDWLDRDYYDVSPQVNPRGPASGSSRARRGGWWNEDANFCRVSRRGASVASGLGDDTGFRVVVPAE